MVDRPSLLLAVSFAVMTLMTSCSAGELMLDLPHNDAAGQASDAPTTMTTGTLPDVPGVTPTPPAAAPWHSAAMRRLTVSEIDRSLRYILGVGLDPEARLPDDRPSSIGFDNNAPGQILEARDFARYHEAFEVTIRRALNSGAATGDAPRRRLEAEEGALPFEGYPNNGFINIHSNGTLTLSVTLAETGRYRLHVRAYQQAAGQEHARMALRVGGRDWGSVEVSANAPTVYVLEGQLPQASADLELEFLNDFSDKSDPAVRIDRNLFVDYVEIEGPIETPSSAGQLSDCQVGAGEPQACAREILARTARRAWRREVQPAELDALVGLVDGVLADGLDLREGLTLGLLGVMLSPHFLFRPLAGADARRLTDYELAGELAFFLWGQVPDEALLDLAREGGLSDRGKLRAQAERMLDDPRADAVLEHMIYRWLDLQHLDRVEVGARQLFPDFDLDLRADMREETQRFLRHLLEENAPVSALFTTSYTFVNARMAAHYDVDFPADATTDRARVELRGTGRRGLLTQASILTALATGVRPRAVDRGKWVLSRLLCTELGTPDTIRDQIPDLDDELETSGLSERETLEMLTASAPVCAGCHQLLDPIGFGLHAFDSVGAWRELDSTESPIDTAGVLPGYGTIDGADELGRALSEDNRLAPCAVRQFMSYALGQPVSAAQSEHVEAVIEATAAGDHRLRDLLVEVALSEIVGTYVPQPM